MQRQLHALELSGQRFGRWEVLYKSHKNKAGEIYWFCRCDCGTERSVKARNLRRGESTSCGCYWREVVTTHGMTKTRTWKSWDSMLQRCENQTAPDFPRYGGRGIKVVPEWHEFERFFADMGERPEGKTLERNDVDGPYGPKNCQWATASAQQRNKRNAILLTVNGETKSVHVWAQETGMSVDLLKWRIKKGWPSAEILTTPARPKRPDGQGRKRPPPSSP